MGGVKRTIRVYAGFSEGSGFVTCTSKAGLARRVGCDVKTIDACLRDGRGIRGWWIGEVELERVKRGGNAGFPGGRRLVGGGGKGGFKALEL